MPRFLNQFIVINGISSETIPGLQVLSLPPITKPEMRHNTDEIDGRAGDIITKLGFSAYDRTVGVLLHHNFDLEQVRRFFAASGEISFSNEPEMIYTFDQLEEISFEKVGHFLTAEITFHVQPYKRDATEQPLIFTASPAVVTNIGNETAGPTFDITGSGTVEIQIDGLTAITVNMTDGQIVIDSTEMEASLNGVLKNRRVTGSYESLWLTPGEHSISWSGTVASLTISNYSRWI